MTLALISLDPANLLAGPIPSLLVVALLILGITNVLMGLVLFRPLVAIEAMLLSGAIGVAAVLAWRGDPSGLDYTVAGGAMGLLGLVLGWMASRETFFLITGWLVAGIVAHALGPNGGTWTLGALAGVVAVIACQRYLKWGVISVFATTGAAMLVLTVMMLITSARGWSGLVDRTFGPEGHYMLGFAGILVALVLALAGMAVQNNLAEAVTDLFMPKLPRRSKRRRLKAGPKMNPPFAKF